MIGADLIRPIALLFPQGMRAGGSRKLSSLISSPSFSLAHICLVLVIKSTPQLRSIFISLVFISSPKSYNLRCAQWQLTSLSFALQAAG